jgi:hypothetical protein
MYAILIFLSSLNRAIRASDDIYRFDAFETRVSLKGSSGAIGWYLFKQGAINRLMILFLR